jgi:hypothetical protein
MTDEATPDQLRKELKEIDMPLVGPKFPATSNPAGKRFLLDHCSQNRPKG